MTALYILNQNGDPEPCEDAVRWAKQFNDSNRILANDILGEARVNTVFLGLDHSFGGATPILWETMIFGGSHDQYQERYTTRDAALAGHAKALALAKGETP